MMAGALHHLRREGGFTVVEALVGAIIMIVGILSAFLVLDSARRLTLVAERQTTMAHRAQLEFERLKSLPYAQLALTGDASSPAWSTKPGDPTYVAGTSGACPGSPTAGAPTYQVSTSLNAEPMVINGCSYTNNLTTLTPVAGTVAPSQTWQATINNGGKTVTVSGAVYDFITWANDPTCSQTSTPGSICATTDDYKRITVVVTMNGITQPSKPAVLSAYLADPNATPPGAPSNSQQNALSSPTTTCLNSQGQTVTCSNTLDGTPLQYFLTDSSYQNVYSAPSCAGNNLHDTVAGVLSLAPAPDQLTSSLPTTVCTDASGNPVPPCFALDLGCGSGAGLPIVGSGSSSCGKPPAINSETHSWLAPAPAGGTSINLNGTGSMTAYLESTTGAALNFTLCIGLYIVPNNILGTLTGNLLAKPIGSSAGVVATAAAGPPAPFSFNFNVGATASIDSTSRIEVVVWVAASSSSKLALIYDQENLASQVTVMTT